MKIKDLNYKCGCRAEWGNQLQVKGRCPKHGKGLDLPSFPANRPRNRKPLAIAKERKAKPVAAWIGSRKDDSKECDRLWALLVKARAGYQSEISGRREGLNSHHLLGKSGRHAGLRWEPLNGVSCTSGEHFFGFHHAGNRSKYEEIINRLRGGNLFEKLEELARMRPRTPDPAMTKIWLKKELEAYPSGPVP